MFIKNFKELNKKSVDESGGKGASLGEMINSGIPVPPGFVVLAFTFDRFLEENDLDGEISRALSNVNYDDVNSVSKASAIIRDFIHDASMPEDLKEEILDHFKKLDTNLVAVRSSATAEDSAVASWAGELESFLNTTEKTLFDNVKKCWSSLFTPRAIFYRQEKGLIDSKVSVAVVVQEMVESEVSGVAFSVHPVTEDENQMIIEAGLGLGEAIVSGSITPDSYVLDKRDFSLTDINIAEQERKLVRCGEKGVKWVDIIESQRDSQKLSGKQVIELAKICVNIEKHYKTPQDIEWAFKQDKFYIVQSRPITTL